MIQNKQDLESLNSASEKSEKSCLICIQSLFNFLRIFDQESDLNSYVLSEFDDSKFCAISADAKLSLGIFSKENIDATSASKTQSYLSNHLKNFLTKRHFNPKNTGGSKGEISLFDVLDKTLTKSGQRKLFDWIQTPLNDVHLIRERQNIVSFLIENCGLHADLENLLKNNFPDLARVALRIQKASNKYLLKYLFQAKQALACVPELVRILKNSVEEGEMDTGSESNLLEKMFISPLRSVFVTS